MTYEDLLFEGVAWLAGPPIGGIKGVVFLAPVGAGEIVLKRHPQQ